MKVSEADLVEWGLRIGREVCRPVFIGLSGPLGAGKSVLARAVAEGAGVSGYMPSPTFNLVFRYEIGADEAGGHRAVIHADLYRLHSPEELAGIGWDEVAGDEEAIVLVEWPERARGHLPGDRWEVRLRYAGEGLDRREIEVRPFGDPPPLPDLAARER
ncbi:MAG: tRNA (adenosine(37)-N6)-threonylcarbamoyltransferase complex ATPase subunit type 1 TsaE [Gemmatimonadetes bacterium]|nr:tRNA (adenosine(37)-N6)-threonylcarbamoyltransferase complex ATPase subunit type 1 TsaE [Gemmatimonadota bacterium]MYE68932.1 tRNA (adenosine(37)-N6)-threonylcarbamoyltransferase complex ATPase subunit type 1 TsaE [Gemmatimonadota bacterium]MYJ69072.1 tRNA (adenosine(37)-N6)-threonylcarbamoyltransferase complex ATPase subunit type 1 TsaE [Gemmatimonadota bacterium]